MAALLDENPLVRTRATAEPGLWDRIFDESVRYYSPIGMITRQTTQSSVVDGFKIAANTEIGLVLAAGNRDDAVVPSPNVFNIDRPSRRQLGFGSGDHMCAGRWAAEESIGRIAVPSYTADSPHFALQTTASQKWAAGSSAATPIFRSCGVDMPIINFAYPDGSSTEIVCDSGRTLMRAALENSVPGIIGECGGQAMCATCHVYVTESDRHNLPAMSEDEEEMLESTESPRTLGSRLGCQIIMGGQLESLDVTVPPAYL
ncbi:cytochrome P450 [Cryobacterium glaciale]|uniref:Cytochrome P450 n=1 Tax=Cryobacterium glaciale TaxID=1259145 RepID=A0A4R8UTD6_9MICO|nr:cytochrome P450 [Cryobacterium glaciale]TFB70606.1 cytochrome P450 [Cryobacterium glaciale]